MEPTALSSPLGSREAIRELLIGVSQVLAEEGDLAECERDYWVLVNLLVDCMDAIESLR
jgi:hypothetical protein